MNDILSICVTVKDRSNVSWPGVKDNMQLFPDCVKSISKFFGEKDKIELVITDWKSTDWPLREWLPSYCNIFYRVIDINKEGFSKGHGINTAVKHALGDTIFVMDCDLLLMSRNLIYRGMEVVNRGGAYFPIPKYIVNQKGEHKFDCGVGNMFVSKKLFNSLGGLPEYYRYGFEDSDFFYKVKESNTEILSHNTTELIHPYHPQSLKFKERFIDNLEVHDKQIQEREEVYKNMKEKGAKFTI